MALHNLNFNSSQFLADESETIAFGIAFARVLGPDMVIYLTGELGAGKTTLARGILRGLGYEGRVRSPTFALVEVYNFSKLYLYHFDFYRFDDPSEWDTAGLADYFRADAICLIEWPERVMGRLPPPDLEIRLSHPDDVHKTGRDLMLNARTEAGERCLAAMTAATGPTSAPV
jgi:tRNA threonylcarbamoyladenosine biosynthesis protein TsaE